MLSIKTISSAWDKFFFKPLPVDSIALFRILWASILLVVAIFDFSNINDFYGPHALTSIQTVKSQFLVPHLNIFHLFNSGYEFVYCLYGLYVISILFTLFGLYTRTSLTVLLVCMVSFHQRNIWLLSSSELLMRLITLLLIFSPAGYAYSVDSLLGRKFDHFKKPKEWSPWVLRLIQIQVSVVYIWTVWHKLKGNTWIDGSAVYYATRLEDMKNFPVPFLLDWIPFIKMTTWATIVIELGIGILIWFKEFRKPVIVIGILFHLGIEYMMSIPYFEIIMISLLLLYFTPDEVRIFIRKARESIASHIRQSTVTEAVKVKMLWVLKGDE